MTFKLLVGCTHMALQKISIDSPLILHLTLTVSALEKAINDNMPSPLVKDSNLLDKGIELEIHKEGWVELQVEHAAENVLLEVFAHAYPGYGAAFKHPVSSLPSGAFQLNIPLKISLSKRVLGTSIETNGTIKLLIESTFLLMQNWSLATKSTLLDHQWIDKPSLKLGPITLPAGVLLDQIVARAKDKLTDELDKALREKLNLPARLQDALQKLAAPKPLPQNLAGAIYLRPEYLRLSAFDLEDGVVKSTLSLGVAPLVVLGKLAILPQDHRFSLPENPIMSLAGKEFTSSLHVRIGYDFLGEVLAKALAAPFSKAGKVVRLSAKQPTAEHGILMIRLEISGDLEGEARYSAKPVFNADAQRMELKNAELALASSSILANLATRVLKPYILKEIGTRIGDEVEKGLAEALEKLNIGILEAPVPEGIVVKGGLSGLKAITIEAELQQLTVELELRGALGIQVDNLPTVSG